MATCIPAVAVLSLTEHEYCACIHLTHSDAASMFGDFEPALRSSTKGKDVMAAVTALGHKADDESNNGLVYSREFPLLPNVNDEMGGWHVYVKLRAYAQESVHLRLSWEQLTRRLRATAGYQVKLERHLVANRFPFLVASRSVTIDNL